MTRSSRRAAAASGSASENDDTETSGGLGRRSTRARAQTVFFTDTTLQESYDRERERDGSDDDGSASEGESNESSDEEAPVRRKSSRSNAFRGGMKEPSDSIKDLTRTEEPSNNKKRRGARTQRSSLEAGGDDSEDESDEDMYDSPPKKKPAKKKAAVVKSPAKRHSRRRRTSKHFEHYKDESSEEESEDEDDASDEDEEENDDMKFNKIIACKSMTLKEWKDVCAKMNTTEVTNGSRWFQEDDASVDLEKYEERFLVKWDGLSFLHCSWETEKDLVEFCDGAKGRLSTFFRKAEGGLLYEADERLDGDYFDPSWITIERILDVEEADEDEEEPSEIILDVNDPNFEDGTGRQIQIKWVNKSYSESNYEFERDLILNEVEYKEELAQYEKRKVKPSREDMKTQFAEGDRQKKKLYKTFGDKIKLSDEEKEELVKEYQDTLASRVFKNGGQLRDYQAEGVSWLMSNHVNKRSSILADEMGLGKTIQTATYVNTVSEQLHTRGPFLIIAPLSTIPHWYREFTGWTNLNTIVYHGSASDRERAREDEFPFPEDKVSEIAFNQRYLQKVAKKWRSKWEKTWMVEVVITTPEMLVTEDFSELAAVKWEILVVDEAHRLKNHNSKLAQNLRDSRFEFQHSLLLTGTPIQNNMQELWTLLNFINPDTFDELDDFLEQYGDIKSKEKVDELHETIRPYILRRLKEDVEKSVPPKEETLIEVELTVLQKQYYRALYEKNLKFLHRNKKSALDGPSINNLAMQLRKCCNHPFLLTGVETEVRAQNPGNEVDALVNASGKFVLLDKLLPRLKSDGHRILLFSQFKIMLDIIEDYLALREFKSERIDGSITGMKRQAAIDRFQSKASGDREQPFIMLLSTRAGGVGINLTAADTCIIFDSDWNPQNDLQAQARCHRIGQTKNVKIYRLLTRKTYEMQMFHMSSMKMGLDQAVLQGIENNTGKDIMTKEEVEKLLKHGAYDIFKEDQDGTSEKESNDFVSQDIDSILERRAKTVIHENTGSNSQAAGGTFSKASFKNTGASDGAATEVDVDDPDFWTKVVGEAKEEEEEELGKRKRAQHSYSEKEYMKRLDAAIRDGVEGSDAEDNASLSSEFSDPGDSDDESTNLNNEALITIVKATKPKKNKNERYQWGGSSTTEWKQGDVEALVSKSLSMYGYGNVSWAKINSSLSLSKSMKPEEVKRMCWALALLSLYEAAEDDALNATRKVATSKTKQTEGGVLALANTGDDKKKVIDVDMEDKNEKATKSIEKPGEVKDQLEESFKIVLAANESWTVKAFADALEYSKSAVPSRDRDHVQSIMDGHRPTKSSHEVNPVKLKLVAEFNENVWPALRSRGWKDDGKNKSNGFIYQGKTFKSISTVLDAIPKYHPELTNMANSLIASVAALCETSTSSTPIATLDPKNVTAKSLKLFLMNCAPLQLLADRKSSHRVNLKRMLNKLVQLEGVHKIVATADANVATDASIEEKNIQLSTLIKVAPQTKKPHAEWTSLHDAILTRAVTKHGWIDSHTSLAAIANDKTIRWGPPFEVSNEAVSQKENKTEEVDPEAEKKFQADYDQLLTTASRAVNFLQKLNDPAFSNGMPAQVLNEVRERLIESYGLAKDDGDEADEVDEEWRVDGKELKNILKPEVEKAADHCEALPSKKKLVKRMKRLAASFLGNGGTLEDDKDESAQDNSGDTKSESKKNFGFFVIDQTDRNNTLVISMIKGQLSLKQSTKAADCRAYAELIFNEIDARIDDLAKSDGNNSLIQEWKKTKEDVQVYLNNAKKGARAAKNILRVIIGQDPVQAKVPTEKLFATKDEKSTTSAAAKSALTKLKKKKAFTAADSALNRALSSCVDGDDGIKDCLRLTSTEILTLTVLASQGLPVFSDDWSSLVGSDSMVLDDDEYGKEEDFRIYFSAMGGVMQAAAEVWANIATKKLQTEIEKVNIVSELTEKEKEKIAVLQKDKIGKEMTLNEAQTYNDDPLSYAKKCIMLLEAIRKHMGPVDLNYAGEKKIRQLNKSENGLGTKVLNWFSKDIQKWAAPLGVVDKAGNVLHQTSITASNSHPQSQDAALMTRRDCRTVFIQIAQQTRLRSIVTKNKTDRLSNELIPKVLKQSSFAMTEWDASPTWWNEHTKEGSNCSCKDDLDLLAGILDYGYGGFDSLLMHDFPFCKRLQLEGNDESKTFTRSTAQVRINHLTRELHALDETEEMMKLVQKQKKRKSNEKPSSSSGKVKKAKSSGIQAGLQAFFKRSSNSATSPSTGAAKKQKTPPTSPENAESDVEVIEIDGNKKRKSHP